MKLHQRVRNSAKNDSHSSATKIVETEMQGMEKEADLPQFASMQRMANRQREAQRPKHPKDLVKHNCLLT